jgi:replicative DNA helicase
MNRQPPILPAGAIRSADTERALIAALCVDPTAVSRLNGLSPHEFANSCLGAVYATVLDAEQAGFPINNPVMLVELLAKRLDLPEQYRSIPFVCGLVAEAMPHHATHYADSIREAARRRALMAMGEELLRRLDDPTDPIESIRTWVEDRAGRLGQRIDGAETVGEIARKLIAEMRRPPEDRKPKTVIWPGLGSLNSRLGAFLGGELIVLAARPGMGKTALAMQMAMDAASKRHPVLFVSLEMQQSELVARVLSGEAGVDSRKLRVQSYEPEDVDKLEAVANDIDGYSLRVFDSRGSAVTVDRIRAMGRLIKAADGLGMIVVDYLQLVDPTDKRMPREQQVADMTRRLKNLAKELECPILCLAQLNRQAENAEKPQLSHLRESGAIEQDADAVLFIHRTKPREAILGIAKHRHAEPGDIPLDWIPERTRFGDAGESSGAKRVESFDNWNGEEF